MTGDVKYEDNRFSAEQDADRSSGRKESAACGGQDYVNLIDVKDEVAREVINDSIEAVSFMLETAVQTMYKLQNALAILKRDVT